MHTPETICWPNFRIWMIVGALGAILIRAASLPPGGFFCDVPAQINAVESSHYLIQFPGYAPYHLLAGWISILTTSAWTALLWIGLFSWAASTTYVVLVANILQGSQAALLSGSVMAFTILPLYFSLAGTSYITDMLYISGMLYHGLRSVRNPEDTRHYWFILFWLSFGIMMRPLSAIWSIPALLLLDYWARNFRRMTISALLIGATGAAYAATSIIFYGSFQAFIAAAHAVGSGLHHYTFRDAASNLFRLVIYPAYGLHLWLLACVVAVPGHWRNLKSREFLFTISLIAPYFLVLLRHIPHAGYYCLLLPVLAVIPWTLAAPSRLVTNPVFPLMLIGVSLLQHFVLRPIPTTGLPTGVANAYLLQYSRAGLQSSYFETLASVMFKAGGTSRQLVPENRWHGSHNPQTAPVNPP